MTEDFHQIITDCGCEINIKEDGKVISYSLCSKHIRQRKDAD